MLLQDGFPLYGLAYAVRRFFWIYDITVPFLFLFFGI